MPLPMLSRTSRTEVAQAERRQSPVTLVSAFEAITAMLTELATTRIVLLMPYPAEVTEVEPAMFGCCGITVTG